MSSSRHSSNNSEAVKCQVREALAFLQQLPMFRQAPLDILKLYAYLSKKEYFKAGDRIVSQGAPSEKMYLILSGRVSIIETHLGKNYRLQELSADNINYFGELALLAQFDWFFSAKAETDTVLLSISREAFRKVMERYPSAFTKAVEKIVALRVQRFSDQTRQLIESSALRDEQAVSALAQPKAPAE